MLVAHDGKIVLVNRRCAEMFGYRREELTGLPVDALVPSEVRGAHQGYRAGYHREPEARPMAERARLAALRKDGATLPVEITLSPVPTASETFVLAVIRDATEPGGGMTCSTWPAGAAADQPRVTRDLLDRVVNRLFQVGLSVQAASGLPGDVARERLAEALDQLDDAIQEIRNYAFGQRPGPVSDGLVGELSRHLGEEALDGRDGDPVQHGPVERLAQRAQRRPVDAGQRDQRALSPEVGQREVGVEHREQLAARAGGLPAQRQPARLLRPGQLADLYPDQLGDDARAHPGQARAVGVRRRAEQGVALAESRQPFPRHGEADVQPDLIANEHPCIAPVRCPGRTGTLVPNRRAEPT